jgi:membrane protease YdiL (CAAX protease family)
MHANLFQLIYAAALGFMLGYLYYKTGRVIYTIAIHAGINFFGSIVSSWLAKGLENIDVAALEGESLIEFFSQHALQLIFVLVYDAFVYAAMIAAIVLPIVFRKRLMFDKGEIVIPSKKRSSVIFWNAGMICMLVFYAFEMILSLIPS